MIDVDMYKAHSYRYDVVQDISYKSKSARAYIAI